MKEKQTAVGGDYRIRRVPLNWVIERKTPEKIIRALGR